MTEDLLDLWLYEGSKGLRYIQASKAYQLTDPYVHYVEKYEAVKGKSQELLTSLEQLPKKVVLYYDEATNFVGMLIRVLSERQDNLVAYVRRTYSNVQVFVKDNYLRLDFNQDGSVSMEDLRTSLVQFYDFLKSYDYIEATTRISSSLYDQAVSIIKSDDASSAQASASAAQQLAEESKLPVAEEQPPVEGDSAAEADTKMQASEQREQKEVKDAAPESEDVTSKQ